MRTKTTLILAAIAALALSASAHAAFPGKNGRIAFGNHSIFSIKSNGKALSDLTGSSLPTGRHDEASDAAYSADGKQIVFSAGKVLGQHSLYVAKADGSGVNELTATAGGPEYPNFSPDGKSVVYDDGDDIFVVKLSDGTVTKLGEGRQPVYSPDGTRIAFVRDVRAESDIWTMDASGGNEKELTKDYKSSGRHGRAFELPDYSPDGKRILVISNWAAGTYLVHVMKANGKGLKPIGEENDPSVQAAAFSPDGEKIVFASYRHGDEALWTMDLDGSHQRVLTPLGGFADGVSDWQPLR